MMPVFPEGFGSAPVPARGVEHCLHGLMLSVGRSSPSFCTSHRAIVTKHWLAL